MCTICTAHAAHGTFAVSVPERDGIADGSSFPNPNLVFEPHSHLGTSKTRGIRDTSDSDRGLKMR